jgi:uncharacterized DUF497 family protein
MGRRKNLLNIKKHGISFQEAVVVFTEEPEEEKAYYDSYYDA